MIYVNICWYFCTHVFSILDTDLFASFVYCSTLSLTVTWLVHAIKNQTSMSCLFSPKCLIRIQYWSRLSYPADKGLMLIHDTHKPTELAQKKTIALIWVMSTSILMPACVLNFLFVWFSKWVAFLKRLHLNWINKKCKEGGKIEETNNPA